LFILFYFMQLKNNGNKIIKTKILWFLIVVFFCSFFNFFKAGF